MKKSLIKYVLPMIAVIIGILWYLLSYNVSGSEASVEMIFGMQEDTSEYDNKNNLMEQENLVETKAGVISVHVCGSVVNPGVYQLEEGARVIQAIEVAGGVCAGAMRDYLNLASYVKDGDRIYVPSAEEVESGYILGSTDEIDEKMLSININTATKNELMQLPGIGESKADSIISYRNEHGSFKSTEDIMLISGIKEAVYSKIKDFIKVQN